MDWLIQMFATDSVAGAVLILAVVISIGLALGSIRVFGISLGIAGVLFSGLLFGHWRITLNPQVLAFAREFGLILFVYTTGMQVGPGFLTSLRAQGWPLNLLAATVILLGAILTVVIAYVAKMDMAAAVGLFAGATTNTPALGAAQEALKNMAGAGMERVELPALGYAVAYPFGVLGIILSMLFFRVVFGVNLERENEAFRREQQTGNGQLERLNLEVENENLDGLTVQQIPGISAMGIVISRVKHHNEEQVINARPDTVIRKGDVMLAVGTKANLDQFRLIVGKASGADLRKLPSNLKLRRIIVTHHEVLGKSLRQLGLDHLYGVTITRLSRADIEMPAIGELKVQFGDMLQVVGEEAALNQVSEVLGNSLKVLNHTNMIPIFVGIGFGILAGSYPIQLEGMPAPVKLGLAGGPLIVAIILSRIGKIGPLVWYMPVNANIVLRELGIVLFLACVGLKAGAQFFEVLLQGDGLQWMAYGALITVAPLVVVGVIGRLMVRLNYLNLCGLMSGSMTDPPALAFANSVTGSDAPAVAYATVYPMTMLLRIVVAQLMVLLF